MVHFNQRTRILLYRASLVVDPMATTGKIRESLWLWLLHVLIQGTVRRNQKRGGDAERGTDEKRPTLNLATTLRERQRYAQQRNTSS